jgi:hypothetical protein
MSKEIKIILICCLIFIVAHILLVNYKTNKEVNSVYDRLEERCLNNNAFRLRGSGYICIPCKKCKK